MRHVADSPTLRSTNVQRARLPRSSASALAILCMVLVVMFSACDSAALSMPDASAQPTPTTPLAELAPGARTATALPSRTSRPAATPQPTQSVPSSPTRLAATRTPFVATPATLTPEPTQAAQPAETAQAMQSTTPAPQATQLPVEARLALLDKVWNTVNDSYLYADFRGVDWAGARARYERRVRAAGSDEEFYAVLADLVAELGDDHSRFLAPAEARAEDALQRGSADYVGVGIISSPDDRSIMVVYVFPGSPAERASIMRRDRITHVDGVPLQDPRTEPSRIRGVEGTSVRLTVKSPGREPRHVDVTRERIVGGVSASSHRLAADPSTGYVIIPDLWTGDMDAQVDRELERLLDAQPPMTRLILDVRGNGGGYRTVLEHILGNFVSGEIGQFYNNGGTYPFEVTGRALQQRLGGIPLAVLVDGGTESYAEVLAAALQYRDRAVVIGRNTAGNTETIYRYDFEDGSRLWVAEQGYRLPDGSDIEGGGVQPDVIVSEDWTAYPESDDPDILRALDALAGRTSQ